MRPVLTLAGLLLCAFASPPRIDSWNGGPKTPDFHHLTVDCRTVVHTHGRNGVWGRWEADLADVALKMEGNQLRLSCAEGAACIRAGRLDKTPDRLSTHDAPLADAAAAEAMIEALMALDRACAG